MLSGSSFNFAESKELEASWLVKKEPYYPDISYSLYQLFKPAFCIVSLAPGDFMPWAFLLLGGSRTGG